MYTHKQVKGRVKGGWMGGIDGWMDGMGQRRARHQLAEELHAGARIIRHLSCQGSGNSRISRRNSKTDLFFRHFWFGLNCFESHAA